MQPHEPASRRVSRRTAQSDVDASRRVEPLGGVASGLGDTTVGGVGIERRCTVLSALPSRRTVTARRRKETHLRECEQEVRRKRKRGRMTETQVRGPHTEGSRRERDKRRESGRRKIAERELVVRGDATSRRISGDGESEVSVATRDRSWFC